MCEKVPSQALGSFGYSQTYSQELATDTPKRKCVQIWTKILEDSISFLIDSGCLRFVCVQNKCVEPILSL